MKNKIQFIDAYWRAANYLTVGKRQGDGSFCLQDTDMRTVTLYITQIFIHY